MYRMILDRIDKENYRLIDHNDERLELLSYLLVDSKIRNKLLELLNHFEGFVIGKPIEFTTFDNMHLTVEQINKEQTLEEQELEQLNPTDRGTLIINLIDKEYGRKNLTTDISKRNLTNLIDQFDDLVDSEAKEIEVGRKQDSFTVNKIS